VTRSRLLAALLGWFVLHTAVWIGLVLLVPGDDGVDYVDLGVLGTPWVRQFVIPLLVVLVLQIAVITKVGWWKPVLRDDQRSSATWMWIFPALLVGIAGIALAQNGFATEAPTSYLIGCAVTMLLVGATEEISFRGILLVGGRRVFGNETRAVLFSSVLFGLFHLPNAFIGSTWAAAGQQVVATAIIGTAIYCLRRVTGSLIPCIVLHAAYDFVLIQGNWDKLLSAV
jgi:membrane protease YdiL (CAAX protease family)